MFGKITSGAFLFPFKKFFLVSLKNKSVFWFYTCGKSRDKLMCDDAWTRWRLRCILVSLGLGGLGRRLLAYFRREESLESSLRLELSYVAQKRVDFHFRQW